MSAPHNRMTFDSLIELRESKGKGKKASRVIRGYAAKFNVESEPMYEGLIEVILPGAFDDVLKQDVRCLKNHDGNIILGRTSSGTLKIGVDKIGLWYECDVVKNTAGDDLIADLRHKNITQSSFGFITKFYNKDYVEYEKVQQADLTVKRYRYLKKFTKLIDVSPVTYAAYEQTNVSIRSLQEFLKSEGEGVEVDETKDNKEQRNTDKDTNKASLEEITAARQRQLDLQAAF